MIKAGIIGSTGYAGAEITRLLTGHRDVEIKWLVSRSYEGMDYADVFGNMFELIDKECADISLEEMAGGVDVIFTATPQGYLQTTLTKDCLEKCRIIDLSADYRIKDVGIYEKWYGIKHESPDLLQEAVYGLTEVNRDKIKNTRLLANPGCYTTCSILTAYPLMKEHMIEKDSLVINAMSGVSGAGRGGKVANLFCEVNESAKAYGVTTHRHTPEIEEQLGYAFGGELMVQFTPHLVPMHRGILATEVARPSGTYTYDEIKAAYDKYYGSEHFIRVLKKDRCPETRFVEGSNYMDVNFKIDDRTGNLILMGALDNLEKGAASQAVQNFNVMFGFDEKEGIDMIPQMP
ncbi:MAG: N-acetyl-gamma-glutamyl-phosphate reductase [Lachnospiraceae bacterium]|nr:N-acetyl-gamma-glutamyl-phosphate reductase [Lachnospiraceae bacterium]